MVTLTRLEAYAACEALFTHAASEKRAANTRKYAGPRFADVRKVMRNNAQFARELGERIAREERFTFS